jgi:hypothetical protein
MLSVVNIRGVWMVLHRGKRWSLTYKTREGAERELVNARACLAQAAQSRRDTDALCGRGYEAD